MVCSPSASEDSDRWTALKREKPRPAGMHAPRSQSQVFWVLSRQMAGTVFKSTEFYGSDCDPNEDTTQSIRQNEEKLWRPVERTACGLAAQ